MSDMYFREAPQEMREMLLQDLRDLSARSADVRVDKSEAPVNVHTISSDDEWTHLEDSTMGDSPTIHTPGVPHSSPREIEFVQQVIYPPSHTLCILDLNLPYNRTLKHHVYDHSWTRYQLFCASGGGGGGVFEALREPFRAKWLQP